MIQKIDKKYIEAVSYISAEIRTARVTIIRKGSITFRVGNIYFFIFAS